jgi:diphthamide biosynthesis protein 7
MTTISSVCSHTLVEPPSCIAFCPSRPEYFVVGTYYLHRKLSGAPSENEAAENEDTRHSDENPIGSGPQKRDGRLILCRLSESDEVYVFLSIQPLLSQCP